jgi:hypothetical protein
MKHLITLLLIQISTFAMSQQHYENQAEITGRLCDKMIGSPLDFTDLDMDTLLHYDLDKDQLRYYTHKLFNKGDGTINNKSKSDRGLMGFFNRRDMKRRDKKYFCRVRKLEKAPDQYIKVLAEGDSWYEFPIHVKDIVHHLIKKNKKFAVKSLGAGGDWMANMLFEREYLFHITTIRPSVFMVSGGGNDITGEQLGALVDQHARILPFSKYKTNTQNLDQPTDDEHIDLVKHRKNEEKYLTEFGFWVKHRLTAKEGEHLYAHTNFLTNPLPAELKEKLSALKDNEYDKALYDKVMRGRKFVNFNYFSFLKLLEFQYMYMHKTIEAEDPAYYDSLLILTQGYDYSIPSYKRGRLFWPKILNIFLKNGRWLKAPLTVKGITEQYDQEAVMVALTFGYNELLVDLSTRYKNMCHVDARGIAQSVNPKNPSRSWFDELHLKSCVYAKVSEQFAACINEHKVILDNRQPVSTQRNPSKPIPKLPEYYQNKYAAKVFKVK